MRPAEERLSQRSAILDAFAIGLSLLAHAMLLWLVLQLVLGRDVPHQPAGVTLVRLPPKKISPPKPASHPVSRPVPQPVPHSVPALQPMHRAEPAPRAARRPRVAAQIRSPVQRPAARATRIGPPVMHFGSAGADSGLGIDLGLPSGGGGNGHGSIDAFDEAVKHRIQSMKTYPPGLPFLPNECVVEYRVTVDVRGNLVDYRITGCGNPFLDAATRAAVLKAAPFPPPPNFGGTRYVVFGTLIYLHQGDTQ